jgi:hypothetical protein
VAILADAFPYGRSTKYPEAVTWKNAASVVPDLKAQNMKFSP